MLLTFLSAVWRHRALGLGFKIKINASISANAASISANAVKTDT